MTETAHVHQWGPIQRARLSGEPSRPCMDGDCRHITLDLYLYCTTCGAEVETTAPGVYEHVEPDTSHEVTPETGEAPDDEDEEPFNGQMRGEGPYDNLV